MQNIKAIGTCLCGFNLSCADLRKYKDKFVAVKKDRKTVVASGKTVTEALNNALKTIKVDELAKIVADNNIVSIAAVIY